MQELLGGMGRGASGKDFFRLEVDQEECLASIL